MNRKLMFSNINNAWCTPQDFFDKLNTEFNFTLDPCATEKSTKCKKFFTAIDDGLKQDWGGERVFVNPPYGKGKRLLPLFQLKEAHFLISILSEGRGFCQDSIFLNKSIDIPFQKINGQDGLIFFDNKIWKGFFENNPDSLTSNDPFPCNSLIILSGLLTSNCADLEYLKQKFYGGLINHLNLKVNSINGRFLSGLTGSPGFSLVDVYTSLTINYSSTPRYNIFHDLIIPVIGGLVKDLIKKPTGIYEWVKKCYEEGQKPNTTVVMLIPSRTDTRYFHDYILGKAEIRFIKGRLTFWDLDGEKYLKGDFKSMTPAPFPSMIAIFKIRK